MHSHTPSGRRLDSVLDFDCIKDVDVMLKYKVSTREIQNKVFSETGRNILAKDIHNGKAKFTTKGNDLNNLTATVNLFE